MAYHTTGTSGFIPVACASVREPCLLHDPARGGVRGGSHADNALKPVLLKAEAKSRQRSFGGKAAAPPCLMKLEPDLDLVDLGPVLELIEADSADPAPRRLVDGRPWAEPLHAPLSQAAFGEPNSPVWGQVSPASDGGVSKETLQFGAIVLTPGPQQKALGLHDHPR